MNQNQIDKIIMSFVANTISDEDFLWLENWLKEEHNRTYFDTYLKINYLINISIPFNRESSLIEIKSKIKTKPKKLEQIRYLKYTAVAATIIILITAGFWFANKNTSVEPQFTEPIIVNNQIQTGTDKATLTLENGEQVVLEKGTEYQTQNATSNGEEIIYKAGKRNNKDIAYNTLTIPRGGQFKTKLSDGTIVSLNSETQIKFPVNFVKGKTREVELMYGEAYFDVSSSTEQGGATFKVVSPNGQEPKVNRQIIEVLGTEFNVKAYKDETKIYTTLVEGKVVVFCSNKNQELVPNQQLTFDKLDDSISVASVDVSIETSWVNGVFIYHKKPLKDIMLVLSRWYNVDIKFENKEMETINFTGNLGREQDIEEILFIFQNSNFINDFEIRNNTIIIK